jgi:serine/threonine-protein kinase HipA
MVAGSRIVDVATVRLWGHDIGAVFWDDVSNVGAFEYTVEFQQSGVELAPLTMPLGPRIYRFPELARSSFRGLPGLLADSLPDDFGNALIRQWLIREGRDEANFSPVEQLCYIGLRGTGALEFRPARRQVSGGSVPLQLGSLVELAGDVLAQRDALSYSLGVDDEQALDDILRVGTSAGGARAKAVVAWNPKSGELRSGQVKAPAGFEYWILKFDGVENREHGLADPQGYGKTEFAYYLMARDSGIEMMPCRLYEENGRSHFMTRRFDRLDNGDKVHMQSLFAMMHLDNQLPGAHSYEQAMLAIERLGIGKSALEEQFRRMAFNVIGRNQDDHTKNIAFLMDKDGRWKLAPAFDVVYSWNPAGDWTSRHQMTINGKRDDFSSSDLLAVAARFGIQQGEELLQQVRDAVSLWPEYASRAGVDETTSNRIRAGQRLSL